MNRIPESIRNLSASQKEQLKMEYIKLIEQNNRLIEPILQLKEKIQQSNTNTNTD